MQLLDSWRRKNNMALVSQYLFNNNLNDSVGSYSMSVSSGSFSYENAPKGYRFGDKVVVLNNGRANINGDLTSGWANCTWEFWLNHTTNEDSQIFLIKDDFSSNRVWHILNSDMLIFWPGVRQTSIPISAHTGEWIHCAIVKNSSTGTIKSFINGEQTNTMNFTDNFLSNSTTIYFGNDKNLSTPYKGKAGNLRIYNSALSQSELQQHFVDESPKVTSSGYYQVIGNLTCQ